MKKEIRVAIAGVGNCASAFIQGIEYYKFHDKDGVMTPNVGGYSVEDIKVVAAFDINKAKVGQDLATAINVWPNCCEKFAPVNRTFTVVQPAPALDGYGSYEDRKFEIVSYNKDLDPEPYRTMIAQDVDVLICYMPVGSPEAARYWAYQALIADVDFVNAMPEFICTDLDWQDTFKEHGLRLAGDDIKSQVGATILHRTLVNLIKMRGQTVTSTYQLNFGGNTDFENMLDRDRLTSKKISKTQAVTSQMDIKNLKIGPSDYVGYLNDTKIAYINIRGKQFGGVPFEIETKLTVQDSPNSAGVMMDAVRACKVAKDRGVVGYLDEVSSWCFKSPQKQVEDVQAYNDFIEWAS